MVEDYGTKMLPSSAAACTGAAPTPYWDGGAPGCSPMAMHGQNITVGRFIEGPDSYGREGMQLLSAPKGAPFYNGNSAGGCQYWGSQLANKAGEVLSSFLFSIPTSSAPAGACTPYTQVGGPTGWERHCHQVRTNSDRSTPRAAHGPGVAVWAHPGR